MKRIILLCLICSYFSIILYAERPSKFGIVSGMNSSKYSTSLFSSKIGFHAGAKTEFGLSKGLYVDAGVLLSLKGGKVDWGDFGSYKSNPYYLEIPVRFGYKYSVNEDIKIFGKLGPYFALGLFGKEINTYGPGDTEKYDLFSGEDAIKRIDLGAGLNIGIEIKEKFQFSIGNDWGLIPVYEGTSTETDLGAGAKNLNLTMSLVFFF